MATVIIPETGRGDNPLTIYINGVKTTLARGVEVTVSDAVAAEIQALNGELLPASEEPLSDGAHLPRVTADDDGKVAKYVDGKWVPADAGDSGGGILVLHQDENGVLDKTWKEIRDAQFVVIKIPFDETGIYITTYYVHQTGYYVDGGVSYYEVVASGSMNFATDSEDGYPVVVSDESHPK